MYLASKTLAAINDALYADQGAKYRTLLKVAVNELSDAFSPNSDPFRTHLGASAIGKDCDRELFYSFRWATLTKHDGRMLRLFNRGHLEEARIVALLRMINVNVYQFDVNGKQFRLSASAGHFGGSGDGFATNIPDWPQAKWLLEFKTHSESSFKKLITQGVEQSKPVHYCQVQTYHSEWKTDAGLYVGVCKNTDELHMEVILPNPVVGEKMRQRAQAIIFASEPPKRISSDPSSYKCKFCDHKRICFGKAEPHHSCRSCYYSCLLDGGRWGCSKFNIECSKELQFYGCNEYLLSPVFSND